MVVGLVGIRRQAHEATIETKAREQQLELMDPMKVLIAMGRLRDGMGKTDRCGLLCEVLVGSFPQHGVRGMREGYQTKKGEA